MPDLTSITSILRAASPQWRGIGGDLGIEESDLDIIQGKPLLIVEGAPGYFREMLSLWLKCSPPKHHWPTITALESALRDNGHEGLANNFRMQLLQTKGILVV